MIVVYKCRLCGKIFYPAGTNNKILAREVTLAAVDGIKHGDVLSPGMYDIHYCEDGSLGVADFQGIQNDGN